MGFTVAETIMFSILQIKAFSEGSDCAELGTGFLVAFCPNGNSFAPALVTNKHILKDYTHAEIPFTLRKAECLPDIGNIKKVTISTSSQIPHPNKDVDLVILPLQPVFETLKMQDIFPFCSCLNIGWIPTEEEWKSFDAIEQIITVGFPKGLRDTVNNLPVFRSGITATPLKYDFNGNPDFLIDVSCFSGCSGSPVFFIEHEKPNVVSKVYLLGIHHSGISSTFDGQLKNAPQELLDVVPTINLPMGLGVAVKSKELLVFEEILQKKIADMSSAQMM